MVKGQASGTAHVYMFDADKLYKTNEKWDKDSFLHLLFWFDFVSLYKGDIILYNTNPCPMYFTVVSSNELLDLF